MELTHDEREGMIDTLEVFGKYPRGVYENFCDERLTEEYNRTVGVVV
ncbi:hypothetical protein ABE042_04880 [Viridibacillus arvi]